MIAIIIMILNTTKKQFCTSLRKNPLTRIPLFVLSLTYLAILTCREKLFQTGVLSSVKAPLYTICVGNITAGGSGKTPSVIYIADALKDEKTTGVLTRGYLSRPPSTPHIVSRNDTPQVAGDEALLLASMLPETIPVVISPLRKKGLEVLKKYPVELCIMDDGLQHLRVKPDIRLCLIDLADAEEYLAATPFSTLPYGIFRENPLKGIKRADRIVFISKKALTQNDQDFISRISRKFSLESFSILTILPSNIVDGFSWKLLDNPETYSYTLLSSIAKPGSFEETVASIPLTFDKHIVREDHHHFSENEWRDLRYKHKNQILCTTKDWIKIRPYLTKEQELLVLTQKVSDMSSEGEKLIPWLKNKPGLIH